MYMEPQPPPYSPAPSSSPGSSTVHHGIQCDSCLIQPIIGVRYKCRQCPDFDLCASCCDLPPPAVQHPRTHTFIRLEMTASDVVHQGITCDGCAQSPLRGNRYHCKSCEDFDLCQYCLSHPPSSHPSFHRYICLASPAIAMRHPNHGCDGCGLNPIIGPRYHCVNGTCNDFDLCSDCMDLGTKHPLTHTMVRIQHS